MNSEILVQLTALNAAIQKMMLNPPETDMDDKTETEPEKSEVDKNLEIIEKYCHRSECYINSFYGKHQKCKGEGYWLFYGDDDYYRIQSENGSYGFYDCETFCFFAHTLENLMKYGVIPYMHFIGVGGQFEN